MLSILALPLVASAQDFETDLNGFRLWQFRSAVKDHFGIAYHAEKREDTILEAYRVNDTSYMVFEQLNTHPENICSIQITGYPTIMKPFKGLVLGDPAAKVFKVLGKPSSTRTLKSPPVTVHYYDNANYSVEIDPDDRLFSIRITVSSAFMDAQEGFEVWQSFKKAVLKRDLQSIFELVRPDVEIYRDGKVLSVKKRYDDFIAKPDRDFVEALIGEQNSVYEELKKIEPEPEMRVAEHVGIGQVFKFYKGTILKEISFFPYNGKYRVYEIAFREKPGSENNESDRPPDEGSK